MVAGPLPVSSQSVSVSPRAGGRGPRPRRTLEESCLAASGAKDGQSMEREVRAFPPLGFAREQVRENQPGPRTWPRARSVPRAVGERGCGSCETEPLVLASFCESVSQSCVKRPIGEGKNPSSVTAAGHPCRGCLESSRRLCE